MHSHFEVSRHIHPATYSMHSAHSHSYHEFFYLVNGSCSLLVGNHTLRIYSGTIVFIPANVIHQTNYYGAPTHERVYAEFTDDYISDIINTFSSQWLDINLFNHIIMINDENYDDINGLLSQIIAEKRNSDPYCNVAVKLLFEQLIIHLLRNQYRKHISEAMHASIQLDSSIQNAINYIDFNYTRKITLNEIANILSMSPSYFSRKFKAELNVGFNDYLNRVRINHAEKLLLESDMSITDIALECGFDNSNYFGDTFKRINKVSPSEFRKVKGDISQ